MDAQAYLRKQGWRGDGHSLDLTERGIKKPLLISKKVDVLGVGLNKHTAVSDQWWLRAFDEGLKNFGTGKESTLATVQKHGVNRGGLYARFVKGEGMPGTIDTRSKAEVMSMPLRADANNKEKKKKRKRDMDGEKSTGASEGEAELSKRSGKKISREEDLRVDSALSSEVESSTAREIPSVKLVAYKKRAKEKGISLESYIKRRVEKKAIKKKEKKRG